MREIRQSGSEGGAMQTNVSFLPLSKKTKFRLFTSSSIIRRSFKILLNALNVFFNEDFSKRPLTVISLPCFL